MNDLFAFVICHPETGREMIVCVPEKPGSETFVPLVAPELPQQAMIDEMVKLANTSGRDVILVKFTARENLFVFQPITLTH